MLLVSPSVFLFSLCLLMSIVMILSSPSFLFTWVALELNTMAFIPLILFNKNKMSSESAIKYFLTQTLASILFILGALLPENLYSIFPLSSFFLSISLLIKLAAAPFHAWLPNMVEAMPWTPFFLLLTIQKLNPLIIFSQLSSSVIVNVAIYLSLIVGGTMGLIQSRLRALLTFSSINHVGWMLSATLIDSSLIFLYFFSYMILLYPITLLMNKTNVNHINQLTNLPLLVHTQFSTFMLLLSLGGLPPFLGFFPKWMVLQSMLIEGKIMISFVMIFMSLLTLYYYLRITFSAFILNQSKWNSFFKNMMELPNSFYFFSMLSLFGFLLIFLL